MFVRAVDGPRSARVAQIITVVATEFSITKPDAEQTAGVNWLVKKGNTDVASFQKHGPELDFEVGSEHAGSVLHFFPFMQSPSSRVVQRVMVIGDIDLSTMPWYQIAIREMKMAVSEFAGEHHHPRILDYHRATRLRATSDEVPWCSSFVNWCMREVGIPGTNSARARSWLDWGQPLAQPREGCVVVLERPPNPAHGHVAFYQGPDPASADRIKLLGGNQSNAVKISSYAKNRVLSYRWPDVPLAAAATDVPVSSAVSLRRTVDDLLDDPGTVLIVVFGADHAALADRVKKVANKFTWWAALWLQDPGSELTDEEQTAWRVGQSGVAAVCLNDQGRPVAFLDAAASFFEIHDAYLQGQGD